MVQPHGATHGWRCQVYADIDVEATRSLEPLLVAAEASDAAVLLGAAAVVACIWGFP